MIPERKLEIPIQGMDCADCARHVEQALRAVPGVHSAQVLLASEKAQLELDPARAHLSDLRAAVRSAGYDVPEDVSPAPLQDSTSGPILRVFGLIFALVLFVVVVGEWLGLFEALTARIPWPINLVVILIAGYPVFRSVLRASLQRRVISHSLMTVGALAAILVGEWAAAAVVVIFMRVGDYAERFTTERARRALRDLTAMAPQTARLLRGDEEHIVPLEVLQPGDIVLVRPGERIPVDGQVLAGQATVDQSAITGESMPVEVAAGDLVFAASLASLGALRLQASAIGAESTFGQVIRLVEQAEANKGQVERLADRFSAYYLPLVAAIAGLTYWIGRDPLATAAVLVVACSCSFALATPVAMLASIGAGARRGLLIKGGQVLEQLAKADVVFIDKTGTVTLGRPLLTDVLPLNGMSANQLLTLAASAERYSEHPLGAALVRAANERGLGLQASEDFRAQPGIGVQARIDGRLIQIGGSSLAPEAEAQPTLQKWQAQGKTGLVIRDADQLIGLLALADELRPEVPATIEALRRLGLKHIELITGDHEQVAQSLATVLDIPYQAGLLPQDKIEIVRRAQAAGKVVVMIGDGVNDAPALAQADVGIAMGAAGSDIAVEAADLALMRDDWSLVAQAFQISRRTMGVVRLNLGFTALYNLIGLTLAALGFLPPVVAAGLQSLPDLGILANASRLLRQKT